MESRPCVLETVGPRLVHIKTHTGKIRLSQTSERTIYAAIPDEDINKKIRKDMDDVLKEYERNNEVIEARVNSFERTPLTQDGFYVTYYLSVYYKEHNS